MEKIQDFEILTTQHGKRKIVHDGFTYVFKKTLAQNKEGFECTKRRTQPVCYAKLTLDDGKIISLKDVRA